MKINLTTDEAEKCLAEYFEAKLQAEVTVSIGNEETKQRIIFIRNVRKSASGNKIQAIKYFRSVTEWGLAESKEMVEKIMENASDEAFLNAVEIVNGYLI